ncbi:HAMP domain-containing protein [bacterium]|nr:HAMP domain-containing protein [bacterium]
MRYDEKFAGEILEKEKELAKFGTIDRYLFVVLGLGALLFGQFVLKIYNVPILIYFVLPGMEIAQNLFIHFVSAKNLYRRWMKFVFPMVDIMAACIVLFFTGVNSSPFFVAYFLGLIHNSYDMGFFMTMYIGIASALAYWGTIFIAHASNIEGLELHWFTEMVRGIFIIYIAFLSGTLGKRALEKVRDIRKAMFQVSKGDLSASMEDIKEKDEFGFLSVSFNEMMESLNIAKEQALAIADDRLDDEVLTVEHSGDFGEAFRAMSARMHMVSSIARQVAADDLSKIDMEELAGEGSLTTAFHKMIERLINIAEYMNQIKAGQLNVDISDEFKSGDVGNALYSNMEKIKEVIGEMKDSSIKLSGSSTEILASSEELNTGATESAASIEETTSTVEEFTTTSRQITENADIVSSYAEDTLNNGIELEEKIEGLITSMVEIKDSTMSTTNRIMKLGEHSKEISDILAIIEEISVQTKLLALNASIEAVGAGEAGKRFGVVAEEIKNLAESVNDSTKKIKEIIETIKTSIEESVISSESQIKDVNYGVKKLEGVREFTERLKAVMQKTNDASKQIKISTMQQKTAGDQLLEAMKDITGVANQTATSTRELVSLVENLNAISRSLTDMADYFEVD